MDEVDRMKSRYAKSIEDGKRIAAFTMTNEWNWFVEHVIHPTIDEYTSRVMKGEIVSEKEEWIIRGMVQGMQLLITAPSGFTDKASEAKKKIKALDDYEKSN